MPEQISFEQFKKLDLRVGKIIVAARVEGSEKLLCLEIDLGEEKRQILSGIAPFYQPEELLNKSVVIVANLEPRKIMGLESQGMLLCANADKPIFLTVISETPVGTKIC
ncbi:MAG: methionine--tRNA ligase subunit beta [Patescibacteria group bacterium]|nr:methionine--tRNA ligase subunit beta [Patescibacteria group bacterium]